MGHYFNLEHLWGPDESECEEGDGVADTPVQFEATYDCASYPLKDECSPTDNGILFFNYMDYVDDECMYMFTEGQKKRMNASLNGFRSTLLGQTNCSLSTSTEDNLPENQIQIYPNPASGYLQVISKNRSSEKPSTLYLFDFMGRMLQSKTSFGACTFDIAGYSPGVYWLKVDDNPQPYKIIVSP